jgi:GntR family transcriptional repressor for pyruvate dehydrogenase complex
LRVSFEPVERTTVSEEIAKKIIDLINCGSLQPGDKLPSERALMDQLNVSRSPIREALRSLSLIGLLETRPGDGTYVSEHLTPSLVGHVDWSVLMDREDIFEWLEVREPLEIQAARLAAERATAEDVLRLEEALTAYHECADDEEQMVESEIRFHQTIAEIGGNETLRQLMTVLYTTYRRLVLQQRFRFAVRNRFALGHREICEAIRAGDGEAARKAMEHHLSLSRQRSLAETLNGKHQQ